MPSIIYARFCVFILSWKGLVLHSHYTVGVKKLTFVIVLLLQIILLCSYR